VIDRTVPGPRTALWRAILADATIDRDEADALSAKLGEVGFWVDRWANDEGVARRWGHLADHVIPAAVEHLRFIRSQQGLTRSPSATGCCRCGVYACVGGWMDSERTWPDGSRAYLCALCVPSYEAAGGVLDGEQLLADVIGVPKPLWGVDYGIRAFIDSRPADPTGTEDRFAYLAEVAPELRRRFVRENPRYATPDEAAEIEAERQARAAAEAARPVALADL
jgi:hypothetical protein